MSKKLSLSDLGSSYADSDAGLHPKTHKEVGVSSVDVPAPPTPETARPSASSTTTLPPNYGGVQTQSSYGGFETMEVEDPHAKAVDGAQMMNAMAGMIAMAGIANQANSFQGSFQNMNTSFPNMGVNIPKVDMHQLRGPVACCGMGVTTPYSVPTCEQVLPRVKGNLIFFSANYILVALMIGMFTAISNFMFLLSSSALAYAWNQSMRADAQETLTELGPIKLGPTGRKVGLGLITVIVFWLFGKRVVLSILYYSSVVILAHAFFRNYEHPDQEQEYDPQPQDELPELNL